MGVFDDERARRQAQHDYERAREERDREFFAARQRQREIWQEQDRVRQERREQLRREDAEQRAADAKAYALDRQQLWELFVKAVSKPDVAHLVPAPEAVQVESTPVVVHVVPLAPDRDLAQVDVPIVQDRPVVVQDRAIVVPLAPDRELAQNDALNVRNVRPNSRPTQVPQGGDLAQVVQHARQRLHRFHRRPRRHRRPPRLQRQRPSSRHAGYTCGPNSSDRQKRPKNIFVLSGKNRLNKRRRAPNSAV